MNINDFKLIKKDAFDIASESLVNNIWESMGFNRTFIMGQIYLLRGLINALDKDVLLDKEDLLKIAKSISEEYEWSKKMVDAIVNEN